MKCPYCPPNNIKGTSHLEEYHKLIEKIHEKIELYESFENLKGYESINYAIAVVLRSLLK